MILHCDKHDILYREDEGCWCCIDSDFTPQQREAAYRDPEFLMRRARMIGVSHPRTAVHVYADGSFSVQDLPEKQPFQWKPQVSIWQAHYPRKVPRRPTGPTELTALRKLCATPRWHPEWNPNFTWAAPKPAKKPRRIYTEMSFHPRMLSAMRERFMQVIERADLPFSEMQEIPCDAFHEFPEER